MEKYTEKKLPLKKWTHIMIYKGVIEARGGWAPRLKRGWQLSNLSLWCMRREFLKLVVCCEEGDLYSIDIEKSKALDDDRLDELMTVHGLKMKRREERGRYIIEYIGKEKPQKVYQSELTIYGNKFIGEDGHKHDVMERGCIVLKTIHNPHKVVEKPIDDESYWKIII